MPTADFENDGEVGPADPAEPPVVGDSTGYEKGESDGHSHGTQEPNRNAPCGFISPPDVVCRAAIECCNFLRGNSGQRHELRRDTEHRQDPRLARPLPSPCGTRTGWPHFENDGEVGPADPAEPPVVGDSTGYEKGESDGHSHGTQEPNRNAPCGFISPPDVVCRAAIECCNFLRGNSGQRHELRRDTEHRQDPRLARPLPSPCGTRTANPGHSPRWGGSVRANSTC